MHITLAWAQSRLERSDRTGGFASHELTMRIDDATPKVLITASRGIEPVRLYTCEMSTPKSVARSPLVRTWPNLSGLMSQFPQIC